jgi:hypothetical protein
MFRRSGVEQRSHARPSPKELLETERNFVSVDEVIRVKRAMSDIQLRGILVWFTVISLGIEMLFVLLHSASVITLPGAIVTAVSVHLGGSGLGISGLLCYIAKDLFKAGER